MAGRDLTVINGLTKEEVLELLKAHSESKSIPEDELFKTREEVKKALRPLFLENKCIFDKYGPLTEERFNPESELPEQWLRKIETFILPNNKKIVETIVNHQVLLLECELEIFELYKQHVDDFEAKHTGKRKTNGTMFPQDILNILE
jgi:hypothetical protein